MFVSRPGSVSSPRNLDRLLRDSYDNHKTMRQAEIDRRTKDNVPLDGLEPLPEYDAEPDLESVYVRLRHLSAEEFQALYSGIQAGPDTTPEERRMHALSQVEAVRALVARVVVEVKGLVTEEAGGEVGLVLVAGDDGMPKEQVALLEDNGLLWVLFSVSRDFQRLSGAEKKAYGSPRP